MTDADIRDAADREAVVDEAMARLKAGQSERRVMWFVTRKSLRRGFKRGLTDLANDRVFWLAMAVGNVAIAVIRIVQVLR